MKNVCVKSIRSAYKVYKNLVKNVRCKFIRGLWEAHEKFERSSQEIYKKHNKKFITRIN